MHTVGLNQLGPRRSATTGLVVAWALLVTGCGEASAPSSAPGYPTRRIPKYGPIAQFGRASDS